MHLTAPKCLLGNRLEVQRRFQAVVRERRKCDSWHEVAALSDTVPILQGDPDATAIQFGIFSEFLSNGDADDARWWLPWIPSVLAENENSQKINHRHDDYISWVLDGMNRYWWFAAALLDIDGAAFYLPTVVCDERLSQFRRQALELFVKWLPEIEAASPFFRSAGVRGEKMRTIWPRGILRLARECGYRVEPSDQELRDKTVAEILIGAGIVKTSDGRPQLRGSTASS